MCFSIIRVAMEFNNTALVTQYISKAEQSADAAKDKKEIAKLKVISGLTNMTTGKFRIAARKFVETPVESTTSYAEIISANDVAIYGGLCGLATFDRSELKAKLIDNTSFKNFLELVPEVREVIRDFHNSNYTTCLNQLEKMKDVLMLDVHLCPHVTALYEQIRQKALKQYVSPFLSVDLNKMAVAFNTTVQILEKEVAQLIMDGGIHARIDSHNKVLYARRNNERQTTYEKALNTGKTFVSETEANIRQLSMLRNDFQVKMPRASYPSPMGVQGGSYVSSMMGSLMGMGY
jgi:COP9 signalosome complex subunit 1